MLNLASGFECIPNHQGQLDDHERETDEKEIPAPRAEHEKPVLKQSERDDRAADSRDTRGAQPMRQETFVNKVLKETHNSSSQKMLSIGQENTRANCSASSRLGT
jgi:hypothetical protein